MEQRLKRKRGDKMKTGLFFLITFLLYLCDIIIPKWLYIPLHIAYIVFCIRIFKELKIRFLTYPIIVLMLFIGLCFLSFSGLSDADGVALGYLFVPLFVFIVLPLTFAALVIGAYWDIKEFKSKK